MTLTQAASRCLANAAAVATALAGGTTTAEATALAAMLGNLSNRQDLAVPACLLLTPTNAAQLDPR